jgi:glucose/arabinose dehydrogenase
MPDIELSPDQDKLVSKACCRRNVACGPALGKQREKEMHRTLACTAAAVLVAACGAPESQAVANAGEPQAAAAAAPTAADGRPFAVTPVARFDAPWAMTFLPDGEMLVTEKAGRMLVVSADGKTKTPLANIPKVDSGGQGGLMDVVLHPKFAQNRLVYFSFSESGQGGKGVALARGRLPQNGRALQDVEVIFRATNYVEGDGHYSGRIAFSPDGHLFFTNGERQKFDPAQDPKVTLGKVLRLNDDGTPAAGNPLAAKGFHPAVWSYGHRNLLGIAFDAQGNLWEQEMGPKGGDEVNLILPGRNYGWPKASNGSHYDGRDIPDHKPGDGFEAPKVSWNPVISPGGLIAYSGAMFPEWKGDLFIGGLSSESLVRVDVNGTSASKGDQWPMGARIREVEQGPDGALWVLEDGDDGRLLKLTRPA